MQNETQLDMSDCVQEQSNAVSAPPPQSPVTEKTEKQDSAHDDSGAAEVASPLIESKEKPESDEDENEEKADGAEEENAEESVEHNKLDERSE